MTKTTRRTLTDEQRAERRAQDREFAEQAVEALRSSEGWQRWLYARGTLSRPGSTETFLIGVPVLDESGS